jgi:hypothetical protein
MIPFKIGDNWLGAVSANQFIKSRARTQLIGMELISNDVKPSEHSLVLFLMMVYLFF